MTHRLNAHRHRLITEENSRWWTLAAMCFALFMVMLDNTVVNIALPAIRDHFHVSISSLSWTVNAYTLVFGVLLVTGGRLGDVFGRKRMFLAGVIVFTLGSIGAGVSGTISELVAFRGLQGVGAAFLMPGSLSIITNTFHGSERGRALGLWAGISGMALGMGPVLGGLLVEKAGWQWIFFINVPVAIVAVPVTMYAVRESRDETASRRIDFAGILTLSLGLGLLVLAMVQADQYHWQSARTLTEFAVAAVYGFDPRSFQGARQRAAVRLQVCIKISIVTEINLFFQALFVVYESVILRDGRIEKVQPQTSSLLETVRKIEDQALNRERGLATP